MQYGIINYRHYAAHQISRIYSSYTAATLYPLISLFPFSPPPCFWKPLSYSASMNQLFYIPHVREIIRYFFQCLAYFTQHNVLQQLKLKNNLSLYKKNVIVNEITPNIQINLQETIIFIIEYFKPRIGIYFQQFTFFMTKKILRFPTHFFFYYQVIRECVYVSVVVGKQDLPLHCAIFQMVIVVSFF